MNIVKMDNTGICFPNPSYHLPRIYDRKDRLQPMPVSQRRPDNMNPEGQGITELNAWHISIHMSSANNR